MKKSALIFILLMFAVSACRPDNANEREGGQQSQFVTETPDVSGFTRVDLAAPLDLEVTQGEGESLRLELSEKFVGKVEARVESGTLVIDAVGNFTVRGSDVLRGAVTLETLEGIDISGAGDVTAREVNAEDLELAVSGAGDISAAGSASRLSVDISGAGDADMTDLVVTDAEVEISGAGDVRVCATSSLQASVSGAGAISYYGDPDTDFTTTGAGEIVREGACSQEE